MAFGNYYGGVVNDKNILDKLAEMAKELREVKGMLINPEVQAEQIKRQAKTEAEKLIAEAEEEAKKIKNKAEADAKETRNEAEEEARKKREQCDKREAEIKECLEAYLKTYKEEADKDVEQWLQNNSEKEKRAADFHEEMCANTDAVQANFSTALVDTVENLEDNIEKLENMKAEFFKSLSAWQRSLYSVEFQPIAQCYQECYRLCNVDSLISGEVFRPDGASTDTAERLVKLKKSLDIFLKRFEYSLGKLDLYLFYPEKGELYDEMWHLSEKKMDCTGGHITSCVVPGVAKKAVDQVDDEVVLQAVVKVEMSEEE